MKCQVCQADLTPGSTFCTNCGTPVPSNPYGSASSPSSPNQGIAPTVLASPQPDPYAPQPNPYAPPANPYPTPSTNYGAGTPPPANPYDAPPAPATPYGTPPPPAYTPTPGAYGAPGTYGQPPYMPQPPQKKGPNGCVIALIIVGVIFVLGFGGVIAAVAFTAHQASGFISSANATLTADTGTVNADLTPAGGGTTPAPTTGTGSGVPSSSQIDPNAEANVSNAQTSSTVDSNYKPTNVTSSFTTSDTIYVTYTLSGKAGYIMEKTYDSTGTIVLQSQNPHSIPSGDSNGYISFSITSSGSYTTGLYWCQKSDCSDAGLAQVVTFTVS